MYKNMEPPEEETEFHEVIDNSNRTLKELGLYREAWTNNWQDGGFRIRWIRTREELQSLSHLEFNTQKFTSKEWIITRAKIGGDLFQRFVERLAYLPENSDVPDYVNANRERFQYLLDIHDKPNAGFLDVDPNDPFA
ncbi:hypothetical protein BGX24_010674 [Mortierella sp. AD032]|nr:hypothetical protein BGX24_010674 [Mortierella sp. AD032]